jgi:hypothetical protein
MIISDITCECGASYRCAESNTLSGAAGQFICVCCGEVLESWSEPRERAYRLVASTDRLYANPRVPPSPLHASPPVAAEEPVG